MAETKLYAEPGSGKSPDQWRRLADCVPAYVPIRNEGEDATVLFAVELMLRTMIHAGAPTHQVKRLLVTMRPSDVGLLSYSEINQMMRRLGLERA